MTFRNPMQRFPDKYRQFAFEYWCFGAGPFRNALNDRKDAWNLRHGKKMKLTGDMSFIESIDKMATLFDEEFPPIPDKVHEYDHCVWGNESGTFQEMWEKMIKTQGEHVARGTMQLLKQRMEQTKLNIIIQMIDEMMVLQNGKDQREDSRSDSSHTHCSQCGANVERK